MLIKVALLCVMVIEMEKETIEAIMKQPNITDAELAKVLGISRSGAAKRRKNLVAKNALQFFAAPDLGRLSHDLMSGLFGFSAAIAYKTVEKLAKKLLKDRNFLVLWIRRTGANNWGIEFLYCAATAGKEDFDRTTENWRGVLAKEVGPELSRIDVGSRTFVFRMLGRDINSSF